jgi:hypothetical protein
VSSDEKVMRGRHCACASPKQTVATWSTGSKTCEITCTLRLKCHGTRGETRFRLSAKRTSPFKSAGASVQSTAGSRGVRISGSNAGYTMFRGSVKSTGYPLHSPVSPSLPLPCVTVRHHTSTGSLVHTYTSNSVTLTEDQFSNG